MTSVPEPGGYTLPLHVEEYGEGDRQIMLLHGFGATSFTWRGWIGALAKEHRVWSVEAEGPRVGACAARRPLLHPRPCRPRAPLDRAEGPPGTDPCGSFHGWWRGATRGNSTPRGGSPGAAGSRVERGLPTAPSPIHRSCRARAASRSGASGSFPKRLLIRWVLGSVVFDRKRVTDAQVEAYSEPLFSSAHRTALVKTAARIIPPDFADITRRIPEIDLPTLLLWGRHDWVVPLDVAEPPRRRPSGRAARNHGRLWACSSGGVCRRSLWRSS